MQQTKPVALQFRSSADFLGAENVIYQLCRGLDESEKFHPIVGLLWDTRDEKPELFEKLQESGIETHLIRTGAGFDRNAIAQMEDLARGSGAKVVHCHGYKEDIFWSLRRMRMPSIVTNHLWKNTSWKSYVYSFFDSLTYLRFNQVVAVSTPIAHQVGRLPYVSRGKISVIPNGLDTTATEGRQADIKSLLSLAPEVPLFTTVASLTPEKGHLNLLKAIKMLGAENACHFAVVGSGPEGPKLEAECRQSGIGDRVHFLGKRSDVRVLLSGSDGFVLPSYIEGLPMALLEALAESVPVIVSAVGEIPNLIRDRDTGLLVAPGDPKGLAEAIDYALENPAEMRHMADRGRETVTQHYSVTKMTQLYEDIYRKVIGHETN